MQLFMLFQRGFRLSQLSLSFQHSDRNAAINLCKLGESVVSPTAPVNVPKVAATIG